MEKEKRRRIICWTSLALFVALLVLVLVLLCRGCSSGSDQPAPTPQPTDHPDLTPEEEAFMARFAIMPHQYYQVALDSDTAFIILNQIDSCVAQGFYLPWQEGSHCVEVLPLRCQILRHQVVVTLRNEDFTIHLKGSDVPQLMDGREHHHIKVNGTAHTFCITPYNEPPYCEVVDNRFVGKMVYKAKVSSDVEYAKAPGYWTGVLGYQEESYMKLLVERIKESREKKELSLTMDIYEPMGDQQQLSDSLLPSSSLRPLIVMLHGGAFYVGDKTAPHIKAWSNNFAQMGYVVAAVNYRLGYRPNKKEIEQAGYDAISDAQNAIAYLIQHAEAYRIDTSRIFLAGTSAGSITALMTAFSPNRDYHILALANMWGAMNDLKLLRNSHTDIISFHGTADQLVPYDQGTPFQDINKNLGKLLFNKLYGSASIDRAARSLGYRTELHSFAGAPHAPIERTDNHDLDWEYMNSIQADIVSFFYRTMVPVQVAIEEVSDDPRHFRVSTPQVAYLQWQVPDGFVVRQQGPDVWVLWTSTAQKHLLQCTGRYPNGIGFRSSKVVN